MDFEGFVRVSNNSGEGYEDAQVRLVVGQINLVEKIAQLARVRLEDVSKMNRKSKRRFEETLLKDTVEKAEDRDEQAVFLGFAEKKAEGRPKQVAKEGLASTSFTRSKGRRRSPTAGRSGCGAWKRSECR